MLCPVDATPLEITFRDGVEIDYCPECRGIWLDRGELDRLLIRLGMDVPARVRHADGLSRRPRVS